MPLRHRRVVAVQPSFDAASSAHRPAQGRGGPGSAPTPGVRPTPPRRSSIVWVVVAFVWVEALLSGVAAVTFVVVVVRGAQLPAASLTLAVIAGGLAALLLGAGRALLRGRRWARSPVMTVQVLLVVMAVSSWRTAPQPWPAAGVALGLAAAGGLLLPPVVAWTVPSAGPADDPTGAGQQPG